MEFHPEDYGAVRDGFTNDQPTIDAAIKDADARFSGGTVWLDEHESYASSAARHEDGSLAVAHIGKYPIQRSILIPHDGITIDGGGTLKPLADWIPSALLTSYVPILAGDDLPSTTTDLALIRRGYGNRVRNIKIDASALTLAQVKAFGKSGISGGITFATQSDFAIENVEIINAWGFTGPITCTVGSEHGSVRGNKIEGAYTPGAQPWLYNPISSAGIWLDGAHYITCTDNEVERVLNAYVLATNSDFGRTAVGNIVAHNKAHRFSGALLAVSGINNLFVENEGDTDRGSPYGMFYTAFPGWPVRGNSAIKNKLTFIQSAPDQHSGILVNYRSIGTLEHIPEITEANIALENEGVNLLALAQFDSPLCKVNVLGKNKAEGRPILWNGGALEADNFLYQNT